jgi:hypothetical protein
MKTENAMSCFTLNELTTANLYLAGERVPAGLYRDVESGREIRLETEDYLPATLDGRVAAYVCLLSIWGEAPKTAQESEKVTLCRREAWTVAVAAGESQ